MEEHQTVNYETILAEVVAELNSAFSEDLELGYDSEEDYTQLEIIAKRIITRVILPLSGADDHTVNLVFKEALNGDYQ